MTFNHGQRKRFIRIISRAAVKRASDTHVCIWVILCSTRNGRALLAGTLYTYLLRLLVPLSPIVEQDLSLPDFLSMLTSHKHSQLVMEQTCISFITSSLLVLFDCNPLATCHMVNLVCSLQSFGVTCRLFISSM